MKEILNKTQTKAQQSLRVLCFLFTIISFPAYSIPEDFYGRWAASNPQGEVIVFNISLRLFILEYFQFDEKDTVDLDTLKAVLPACDPIYKNSFLSALFQDFNRPNSALLNFRPNEKIKVSVLINIDMLDGNNSFSAEMSSDGGEYFIGSILNKFIPAVGPTTTTMLTKFERL